MKAKWVKAVYILAGVLIPIPLNLLAQYFTYMSSRTFQPCFVWAQYALMFFFYFFLGAYLVLFKNLKVIGTPGKWRVRWVEFALGAALFVMGFVMKLEHVTRLVTSIRFIYENDLLYKIFSFNDALYTWAILAGFLMADAFEKLPSKEEALEDGPRPDESADGEQPGA
jgi:hypothetical protein